MNNKWVYDLEVFGGNFFSATFINVDTEEVKTFLSYKDKNCFPELENFVNQGLVLIGYNNIMYDGAVLQYALKNKNSKTILRDVFEFSNELINSDRDFNNYQYRKYQYPENPKYSQIDLMKVISVGAVAPSLKLVGIILHWRKVQDLPYEFDKPVENILIANEILKYNENDVRITLSLYKKLLPQLELREKLGTMYGLDLMSCSDSKIGDRLLEKFYKDKTGISNVYSLKDKVVEYEQFMIGECIFDDIHFKSNHLKRIKKELEKSIARKSTDYKIVRDVDFGGVVYQIRSGGLHSVDTPALFKTDENYIVRDCDFNSFYTSMMIKNKIAPLHIGKEFLEILEDMTRERVSAKHTDEVKAAGLKISINAIYGKLGFVGSWFKDKKALLKVTISGQLYLMMLIERFVLAGIEVISANTDGIVCRIKRSMEQEYYDIANSFSSEIGIGIEFTDYDVYARRDVNNYISRKPDGKVKYKGCFTPEPEIKKGYAHPIVPKAVYKNILEGIPVEDTIRNHDNILDFCISKKMDSKFQAEFHLSETEVECLQKTNRFYIANEGGKLLKRNKDTGKTVGLFVSQNLVILNDYDETIPISEYDINYDFYIEEARKLVDDVVLYDKEFQPFVDEPEDFQPPQDTIRREEFFYKFQKVKGLPEKVIDNLMWLEDNFKGESFFDFLVFAEDNSKMSSKMETFIKLNHFSRFGNQKNLLSFYKEFTKSKNKYSSTLSDKTKKLRLSVLEELWNWRVEEYFSIHEQIQNEASIIGQPYSIHPTLNKYYGYVTEINTKSYHPKIRLIILKTGEEKELKVLQDTFYEHHFKEGDILLCKTFKKKFRKTKDENGKWIETENFDWFVETYYKMKPEDKFIEDD